MAKRRYAIKTPPEREASPNDPVTAAYARTGASATDEHTQGVVDTARPTAASATGAGATGGGTGTGAGPEPKKPRNRIRTFARTVLVIVLSASGYIVYRAYTDRHPQAQMPPDPSKKTIVVLGNGWAATSFLKGIDTTDYNVVRPSPNLLEGES